MAAATATRPRQGTGSRSTTPSSPGATRRPRNMPHGVTPSEMGMWCKAVERDWKRIQNAPAVIRQEPLVILGAMRNNWQAVKFASEALLADRTFVLDAVSLAGLALQAAPENLRSDREVVMAAIENDGQALRHAFLHELRDDYDIVQLAVQKDWRALEFASDRLRADRALALEAVQQHWRAIELTDEMLRDDPEVMLEAVRQDGEALRYATTRLRRDPGFRAKARERGLLLIPEHDARIVPGMEGHIGDLQIARRMEAEPFQFKPDPVVASGVHEPTVAEAAAARSAEWVAANRAKFAASLSFKDRARLRAAGAGTGAAADATASPRVSPDAS